MRLMNCLLRRSLHCVLLVLLVAIGQANPPDDWIDDDQIEQALAAGATSLIEAKRAPELPEIARGLAKPSCRVKLPEERANSGGEAAGGHAPAVDSAALYEQACKSVVIVGSAYTCPRCENLHVSGATGFFLTTDGAVVTNYHVIDQQDKRALVVMTRDGRVFPVVEALAGNEKSDVAIVRIEPVDHVGRKASFTPLRLAGGSRVGENIRVIHHADGRYYTLTQGIVSRRYTHHATPWLTITADYARGSSGGPLLDDTGRVVGIVASTSSVYYDEDDAGHGRNLQMVWKQCVPVENINALIAAD